MAKKSKAKTSATITLDDHTYDVSALSEKAKACLINIQLCDDLIQQRRNEWAIADTARLIHTEGLKLALKA